MAAKAPNGEIIASSQGYETKAGAEKGVEAVKTHSVSDFPIGCANGVFDVTTRWLRHP